MRLSGLPELEQLHVDQNMVSVVDIFISQLHTQTQTCCNLQACGQATHTHAAQGIIFLVALAQLCTLALKVSRQIFWEIFPAGYPQEVLETTVLSYLQ